MIKILYGESNFKKLRVKKCFYQDRTSFIETLENWTSNYIVFLRPRRFGKSLFVSTPPLLLWFGTQSRFSKLIRRFIHRSAPNGVGE